ncbi:LacI family DNA-binding transcriptional regulator [Macrococcus sp. EM39E]|uniref:LacI family DNA-binding transcriptional regulator n=1 Tax=Macrococcus animalis TaxID=3395467 RepID=UPI0039BFD0AD
MSNISIKEIAKLAGVSTATVSRVINDNGRFSEETRKKVMATIKETGYQIDYSAKTFRMKKSFSIGIIVPDITNYFFAKLVENIEKELFKEGYSTIICNTARDSEKEMNYIKMLESKMIDGFVIISGAEEFILNSNNTTKDIPYVCIDREPSDFSNTVFISSNHYEGSQMATNHVINNGAKKPIFVLHKRHSTSSHERLKGFIDVMKSNHINHTNSILYIENKDNKYFTNYINSNHPDAIIFANDQLAIDCIPLLKKLEVKIPYDIQVFGFDDIPACEYIQPSLSTIRQDTNKIAKVAANSLLKIIQGKTNIKGDIELINVHKVIRESTKNES